jgi:hypothetical protein
LAVSVTAGLLLTSQLFEIKNPALALKLNPLSTEARIKLVVQQLTANPARAAEAMQTSLDGLKLNRLDARFLSLAGLSAQVENKPDQAEAFFRSSLAISPTEFQALSAMLRIDLAAGRSKEAAQLFDLLSRRWGSQSETFTPLIPAIVSDPAGLEEIRTLFIIPNARRDLVLLGLLEVDGAVGTATDLVAQWAAAYVPDRGALVNQVTTKLLNLKQDQAAYLFHLSTGGADSNETAYIKNGTFSKKPDGSVFDWTVAKQRGVNVTIDSVTGAWIQFLDSPVLFDNLSQLTALAPGRHEFQIEYMTRYLKTPAPVRAEVRCRSGKLLASITIDGQSNPLRKSSVFFDVPQADCVLQRFSMSSDRLPESWQNRYSGEITLRSVIIERIEQ